MKKIIIVVVSMIFSCSVIIFLFEKKRRMNVELSYKSQKTDLTDKERTKLEDEAKQGNVMSASKLHDFHMDHTMNYDQALHWMEIAIKNGANWYTQADIDNINLAIKENNQGELRE